MKPPPKPAPPSTQLGLFGFGPAVAVSTTPKPTPPVSTPANVLKETEPEVEVFAKAEVDTSKPRAAKYVKKERPKAWFGPYELQQGEAPFSQNYLVLPLTIFDASKKYCKSTGKRVRHIQQTRTLVSFYIETRIEKKLPYMDVTVPHVVGKARKYGVFHGDSERYFVIDVDKDPIVHQTLETYRELLKEFHTEGFLAVHSYLEGKQPWSIICELLPGY